MTEPKLAPAEDERVIRIVAQHLLSVCLSGHNPAHGVAALSIAMAHMAYSVQGEEDDTPEKMLESMIRMLRMNAEEEFKKLRALDAAEDMDDQANAPSGSGLN